LALSFFLAKCRLHQRTTAISCDPFYMIKQQHQGLTANKLLHD
jgi:hypothetical protein